MALIGNYIDKDGTEYEGVYYQIAAVEAYKEFDDYCIGFIVHVFITKAVRESGGDYVEEIRGNFHSGAAVNDFWYADCYSAALPVLNDVMAMRVLEFNSSLVISITGDE